MKLFVEHNFCSSNLMMVQERKEIQDINIKLLLGFFFPLQLAGACLKCFSSLVSYSYFLSLTLLTFPFFPFLTLSLLPFALQFLLCSYFSLVTCFPISLCSQMSSISDSKFKLLGYFPVAFELKWHSASKVEHCF